MIIAIIFSDNPLRALAQHTSSVDIVAARDSNTRTHIVCIW